jgi:hypothetical protein
VALATLDFFTFLVAAPAVFRAAAEVFRAALLPLLANFFASRSTIWTALLRLIAFCAASALAAIVPSAVPIDSATLLKMAPFVVRLCLRALIACSLFLQDSFLYLGPAAATMEREAPVI